jgi:hypothetical protein
MLNGSELYAGESVTRVLSNGWLVSVHVSKHGDTNNTNHRTQRCYYNNKLLQSYLWDRRRCLRHGGGLALAAVSQPHRAIFFVREKRTAPRPFIIMCHSYSYRRKYHPHAHAALARPQQ